MCRWPARPSATEHRLGHCHADRESRRRSGVQRRGLEDGPCIGTRLIIRRHGDPPSSVARRRTTASATTTEPTPRSAARRPRRRRPMASTVATAHHGHPASSPRRIAGIQEFSAERAGRATRSHVELSRAMSRSSPAMFSMFILPRAAWTTAQVNSSTVMPQGATAQGWSALTRSSSRSLVRFVCSTVG